jgi:hypothetical protein
MNETNHMKESVTTTCLVLALAAARHAAGHGTPIQVQATTALSASGGTPDTAGFAPMLFFESTEEGDPFATLTLPNVGPVVIWQTPGFHITGLNTTSSLSIEVLSRPANDALPIQYRSLWYWNPTSSDVEATTAPLYLLGTAQRFTTLDPATPTPPPPFLLVNPVGGTQAEGGQQGFHNHSLLSYALDNDHVPPAATGAYGFFARLVSNQYTASNWFLVVLNLGVDYERMSEAALAINAAAFLPGDFNHDDRVDAADYVVWRESIGAAPEYALWRGNFGAVVAGSASASSLTNLASDAAAIVPEPATLLLTMTAWLISLRRLTRSQRRRPAAARFAVGSRLKERHHRGRHRPAKPTFCR